MPTISQLFTQTNPFTIENHNTDFSCNLFTINRIDTSTNPVTAILPPTPNDGDQIKFLDAAGSNPNTPTGFGLYPLTIAPSGKSIQGFSDDLTIQTENSNLALIFNSASDRWDILDFGLGGLSIQIGSGSSNNGDSSNGNTNNETNWTPSEDTELVFWLDGSISNSFTDLSSNTQNPFNSLNLPTYALNAQNGLSAIEFDGSQVLSFSNTGVKTSGEAVTIIVVAKRNNVNFNLWHESNQAGVALPSTGSFVSVTDTIFTVQDAAIGTESIEIAGNFIDNQFGILIIDTSQPSIAPYLDGNALSLNLVSYSLLVVNDNFNIGAFASSDGFGNNVRLDINSQGQIAEYIITSSGLSTGDREKYEGYLAHKWGLTNNLPANHPYKNNAPTTTPASNLPLSDATVEFIDLSLTNPDLKGFQSGFVHNDYGYLVPSSSGSPHGKLTRVNLTDFSTVEFIDLSLTNADLRGFQSGFVHNDYTYLVPYGFSPYHGNFTRVNLTDFSTVEFVDLTLTNTNLRGFQGGFVYNDYAYLVPYRNSTSRHGFFTRVNLTDFSTVEFIDLSLTNPDLIGFRQGFVHNDYAYLVPHGSSPYHGKFTRVNLTDFSTVEFIDLSLTNTNLKGFIGGFVDGNYAYLVPYNNGSFHGNFTRVNLTDFSTVEFIDLSLTNTNLRGFRQGFVDGNYAYLVPYNNDSRHGFFTRVNLTDFSTVEFVDLSLTNTNLKGFVGGFVDGNYAYLVPYNNGSFHGNFTKISLN